MAGRIKNLGFRVLEEKILKKKNYLRVPAYSTSEFPEWRS
jgi:hypothetical protein